MRRLLLLFLVVSQVCYTSDTMLDGALVALSHNFDVLFPKKYSIQKFVYPEPQSAAIPVILPYKITIVQGDILDQNVQVIVNAANCGLVGGGGIDGAIHKRARARLYDDGETGDDKMVREAPAASKSSGQACKAGDAFFTESYFPEKHDGKNNTITHVIHAVGPNCTESQNRENNKVNSSGKYSMNQKAKNELYSAFYNSLNIASEHSFSSIALPFISSAIFACDNNQASEIALQAVVDFGERNKKTSVKEVRFVLFSDQDFALFNAKQKDLFAQWNVVMPS